MHSPKDVFKPPETPERKSFEISDRVRCPDGIGIVEEMSEGQVKVQGRWHPAAKCELAPDDEAA
jgi:hypothetical protein